MIRMNWIITDRVSDYPFETPDHYNEEVCIYGYYWMRINSRLWGEKPFRDVRNMMQGPEDLLSLFTEMKQTVALRSSDRIKIMPLQSDSSELVFHRENDNLWISEQESDVYRLIIPDQPDRTERKNDLTRRSDKEIGVEKVSSGRVIWQEKVSHNTFCLELMKNLRQFLQIIEEQNKALFENKYMQKLKE